MTLQRVVITNPICKGISHKVEAIILQNKM